MGFTVHGFALVGIPRQMAIIDSAFMSGDSAQRAVVGIGVALMTITALGWWQHARRRRVLGSEVPQSRLRVFADRSREFLAARLLLLLALGSSVIVIYRPHWADAHRDTLKWAMLVFLGGGVIILDRRRRGYLRAVSAEDGTSCPVCGYRLRGLPDQGNCPECGEEYTIKSVQRYWRRAKLL